VVFVAAMMPGSTVIPPPGLEIGETDDA